MYLFKRREGKNKISRSFLCFPNVFYPQLRACNSKPSRQKIKGSLSCLQQPPRVQFAPLCHQQASRVHSRYVRTVADLPWAGFRVHLQITIRRFFCDTTTCPRRIFAERLGEALPAFARRTNRLTQALCGLAFVAGAEGGARQAHAQAMPVSPRTLLRLLEASLLPATSPPRVVGIDEWAWKKGRSYGTILIDLERKQPVDLLPDRDADSVAAWFQKQASVEIIVRDRSGLFADGALRGAPKATQVIDRYHLVKNLVEALERFFLQKRAVLKTLQEQQHTAHQQEAATLRPLPLMDGIPASAKAEAASLRRHVYYVDLYEKIHHFHAKNVDVATIARHVGVSRQTVYRYLHMQSPPERTRIQYTRKKLIEPYKPYLLQRWNEGCRNAQQLWREITQMGYSASVTTVSRFIGQLRQDSGTARSFKQAQASAIYSWTGEQKRPFTALQAARLLVSREERRSVWQQDALVRLSELDQDIEAPINHVHRFLQMVRQLQGESLDGWLQEVEEHGIAELRSFAQGLRKEYQAVKAGLTLTWSNGPTEAQIQRLKLLKRQMYGQAGFTLLRQRVLHREEKLRRKPRKRKPNQTEAA
jgi:transposase